MTDDRGQIKDEAGDRRKGETEHGRASSFAEASTFIKITADKSEDREVEDQIGGQKSEVRVGWMTDNRRRIKGNGEGRCQMTQDG